MFVDLPIAKLCLCL